MEAMATPYSNASTAETGPSPEEVTNLSNQTKDDSSFIGSNSNDNSNSGSLTSNSTPTTNDTTLETQQSHFEGRGNLDTLVAAALKPLTDDYPQRHHSSPQRFEPPSHGHSISSSSNYNHHNSGSESSNNSVNNNIQHTNAQYTISSSRSLHPVDPDSNTQRRTSLDHSSPKNTDSSSSVIMKSTIDHLHHEHTSSKFHYREQGRTVSDEESDDDPSLEPQPQDNRICPAEPPRHISHPSHSLHDQSDSSLKTLTQLYPFCNLFSSGDSPGYARRTGDKDSIPDHHVTARHLTSSSVQPSDVQSEGSFEQRCADTTKRKS
ncbi:hypothetical protein FBU30_004790 [Linnemannia zychae]|nr:hypothetical protein FBU30_004790 [Linnemannia zychae]